MLYCSIADLTRHDVGLSLVKVDISYFVSQGYLSSIHSYMQTHHRNIKKFTDVETFILNHLEKRMPIADLATEFQVSESYLRKGFKLYYGITLHQYHLKRSMDLALEQMQQGEQIKVIAIRFGYYFPGSFTRAFKSIHNYAPQKHKMYVRV